VTTWTLPQTAWYQALAPAIIWPEGHHPAFARCIRQLTPLAENQGGAPRPTDIVLHKQSGILEVVFEGGEAFRLPCELLRVYSPSAEVRGHGPGQEVLQTGKREVGISAIEPVGNYAVRLVFTDGHDTGLYSWDYLYSLGKNQETLWNQYLERMARAGASRDAATPAPAAKPGWKKL
jgi:DUF971 family protein